MALRTPHHAMSEVNLRAFASGALAGAPEVVDCTLENGASAPCVRLVVEYQARCRVPYGRRVSLEAPTEI